MPRLRIFAALALSAVLAGAADQKTPPPPAHQRQAASARLSDKEIEAAIRVKLAKSKIGADHFQFHVQGGVATIEGKTDVIQHKGAATRMARTAGAVAVNNRIQISEAARERAAANLANGRRRAQVKRGEARSESRSDSRTPSVAAAPVRTAPKTAAAKTVPTGQIR